MGWTNFREFDKIPFKFELRRDDDDEDEEEVMVGVEEVRARGRPGREETPRRNIYVMGNELY